MSTQARAIYRGLTKKYPDVRCELDFETPFQLLCATVLSAQCTDKRVNMVTPKLFKKFGTPKKMAGADLFMIEDLIRSTGFFRGKAQSLKSLSMKIMDDYGGQVPADLNELVKLRGVGR